MKINKNEFEKFIFESQERFDLFVLFLSTIVILAVWFLFLGFVPSTLISGNDGPFVTTELQSMIDSGIFLKNFQYSYVRGGGHPLSGITGANGIYQFLSFFNFGPTAICNIIVFFIQIIYSFFCIKLISCQSTANHGQHLFNIKTRFLLVPTILLTAFAPILGWRLGYGHLILVLGAMTLIFSLSTISATINKKITITHALLLFTAFLSVIQTPFAAQTIVYAVCLGSFIIVGYILNYTDLGLRKHNIIKQIIDSILPLLIILLCAILASFTALGDIVSFFLGSNTTRNVREEATIYSYTTATIADFISSIFLSNQIIPSSRDQFLWHESNYPIGPIIIFLVMYFQKNFRLLVGFLISVALISILSMNITPLSDLLLSTVPILKSFRVPSRAWLIISVLITPLALTFIFSQLSDTSTSPNKLIKSISKTNLAIITIIPIVFFFVPDIIAEIVAWFSVIMVTVMFTKQRFFLKQSTIKAVLLFSLFSLSIVSIRAFNSRLISIKNFPTIIENAKGLANQLKSNNQEMNNPLVRTSFGFAFPAISVNQNVYMGISSLDGYFLFPGKFSAFVKEVWQMNKTDIVHFLKINEQSKNFKIFQQLYNIKFSLVPATNNNVEIRPLLPTNGAAWFSNKLIPQNSLKELVNILISKQDSLKDYLREQLLFINSDLPNPLTVNAISCEQSEVKNVTHIKDGNQLLLSVKSVGDCPLTIATNYADNFVIEASSGSAGQSRFLTPFAGHGVLLSFIVPDNTTDIVISNKPSLSRWFIFIDLIGWSLLIFYCTWIWRQNKLFSNGIL